MRFSFLITLKSRRYSRYELGRLFRLGIYHSVHSRTFNCGVFSHMNPDEEPEVEYDLIGDLPEEEPEESEDELQRIEWERIRSKGW